jgi:outer membrane protein TolC
MLYLQFIHIFQVQKRKLEMRKISFLLVNFIFIGFFTLHAQQTKSLEDCIKTAVENNFSIRIIQNQQRIAVSNFTRGNAGLLPSLDLRSSYAGNLNNTNRNFIDDTNTFNSNIYNTTTNIALQGQWTIFDGFNARYRYKQLEELNQLSEINTRLSIENTIAQLASEYYFFIQQTQLFSNLKYAVNLSKERVRIEQEHFLLGSGSKVRLLQAQVNLNADSSRLERQYEVLNASRVRLNEIMAMENLNDDFLPADSNIVINNSLNYNDLYNLAMERNVSILAAEHNINLVRQDLKQVSSQRYPYLNLSSGYGYTHNTFQNNTVNDQQTWGMNYSLTLGLNLYNGSNQTRLEQNARIEIENSQISLNQIKQAVTADFITLFNSYTNNLSLLNLETENLSVARENLDIAFERYRLGGLSGFELREVQKDLLEAEERLLSIQYQTKIAEIGLLQISGKILDELVN